MKFSVSNQIFEKFPNLMLGVIAAKGINNDKKDKEITDQLRFYESKIRANFNLAELSSVPQIGSWRNAYSLFGAKPSKYKCSIEALIRRVLKGDSIPSINSLVDIYNGISLKYVAPVGGEDIDKIKGDIQLRFAEGKEQFTELGSIELSHPNNGEVVYADDREVLCRRFNWHESENTKLTEKTKNAVVVIEILPPGTRKELESALQDLVASIKKYCGGDVKSSMLDKENNELIIK